jgi:hypothetical protein
VDIADLPPAIDEVRRGAADAGKDPDTVRIVIRGVARLRDQADSAVLTGPVDRIRSGLEQYAAAGATEVFVDLNFDELIGTPDADPARSMDVARQLLEEFAPAS